MHNLFRGYSSVGRALAWHARGQRFESAYLHQGHDPFTVGTGVRIPVGTPILLEQPMTVAFLLPKNEPPEGGSNCSVSLR